MVTRVPFRNVVEILPNRVEERQRGEGKDREKKRKKKKTRDFACFTLLGLQHNTQATLQGEESRRREKKNIHILQEIIFVSPTRGASVCTG